MFTLPQLKGTANFCQQVWQRELCVPPQHQAYSFRSHLYRERLRLAKNLYKYDLRAHFGCVNAVEFSKCGELLASAGDDKRILLWNVEKAIANIQRPQAMATEHSSNIFCLGFDSKNKRLLSGGNDDIVIGHDIETLKLLNVYKHDSPIYGLSIDATCDHIFATASENGQVLLFDDRINSADPTVIAETNSAFQAVEFHPLSGLYLVTANARRGAAFFDIRKPQTPVVKYGLVHDPHSCMSVRFNSTGNYVLALSRRRAPVLYRSDNAEPVATFFHAQYYNSCTMKSCTFAGEDDEFILSGSDDFNLYAWRIDGLNLESYGQWVESAHMVLHGHRSIVNQVRYNKQKCLLASSGVEKIVKLWSPFEQKGWTGSLTREATSAENARELYLHIPNNILASPHSWSHMSHDYSSRNTNEDPRMMAFFDALIQQEIEDWEMTSYSTDSQDNETAHNSATNLPSSESSSGVTSSSECDDDDDGDHDTGRAAISSRLRNVDVPSALEAQETEPCRENNRRTNNHYVRTAATQRLRNSREHNNRIAYLISTKRNYLRRLAKRGMKRKSCTCTSAKTVKKEFPNPPRILRQTFLRIPHFNRVNQRRFMDNVLRFKRNRSNNGQRLRPHKLFRVRMPTPCPASSSEESLSGTGSSSISSSSSSTSILDNDDLKNPLPSTSSRAIRSTQTNSAATPSTSTGHTSSLADIVRLRQNQQQILGTDDETESDDNDLTRIALTRSRLRDEIRETIPQKKLNGVRRLNDELTGARLSNRIQAVIEEHNVSNVNNNEWITNTLRRAYDEDFLDVENSSINTVSQTNDIQSNGTTRASTPKTRRKNLRNRCESPPVDIVNSEQESKETQTQKISKRKRGLPQNTDEVKKSKKRIKNLDTQPTTPTMETESIESFISKTHKCSKHREIKSQSELKAKKSPNCLKKKTKEKFVNSEKLKTRKKRARKTNGSSDPSTHKLSDDQPSTSAAARAALTASSLNSNEDLNNELEDSNETNSNIYRNFNNCVKGGSETNDEYQKKVERVKRVCAKNNESDSD